MTQINRVTSHARNMNRMADNPPVAQSRVRVAALCEQLEARVGAPVRVIETHVSWGCSPGRWPTSSRSRPAHSALELGRGQDLAFAEELREALCLSFGMSFVSHFISAPASGAQRVRCSLKS